MAARSKKKAKSSGMKEMRVSLGAKKGRKSGASRKKKMSFLQWVSHYVKASGGNPV